ncbi:MAG: hypothetical protein VR75_15480 [Hyphomonadaceae bacterium BRH_c29]|nr:MAG: hypothetical protein VR75_15480 [Hyphomonadaceae bacterium BRH_c29]
MSGYGPFDGFTLVAIALAVGLSALVSLIGTSGRKRNIALGEAQIGDLAEMTGIRDPKRLQEVFGPPDMGRVWRSVTLLEVRRARTPEGWLMSSDVVDYACMAAAVIAMFVSHKFVPALLLLALGIQIAGWVVSTRLPR